MESNPDEKATNSDASETLPDLPIGEAAESENHNSDNSNTYSGVPENGVNPSRLRRFFRWCWRRLITPNLAEWCMVGVTVAISIIGYYQLKAMSGQLQQMQTGATDTHTLAQAAKKEADKAETISSSLQNAVSDMGIANSNAAKVLEATVDQFHLEQRAWIGVPDVVATQFTKSQGFIGNISFFNSGKTPARNVQFSIGYVLSPVPIDGPPAKEIKALEFRPVSSIAPQGRYSVTVGVTAPGEMSTSEQVLGNFRIISNFQEIESKRLTLFYFGILKYDDIFGKHRETSYCAFLANPDTKQMASCHAFNDVK